MRGDIVITWRGDAHDDSAFGELARDSDSQTVAAAGGLVDQAEMRVEGDALVLRRPKAAPRNGWAEACRELAATGDDVLVLPEFANEGDAELTW